MQIRDRVRELRRVRGRDLTPNPRNWRTHPPEQLAALWGVLAEVGFAGAALAYELADGALRLIDGHARAEIAPDAEIPVLVLDVTEAEADTLLATFDPLGAMAGADAARLDALLRDVRTSNDAVAAMLDALATEVGCAGAPAAAGAGGDEFEAAPAGDGPTRTTVGDLWVIGGTHRLLVGDATDPAAVAHLFAGAVPFLMVTDPPYGVDYDPDWRNQAAEAGHLNYAARRTGTVANDGQADWAAAYRLFPGAVAYVWHAGRHAAVVAAGLEEAGLAVRSQIVWRKPHFAISRGHYHWQHEPCWYAARDGESARWCGDRTQTTVWDITNRVNAEDRNDHGTQKPLECMARPVRNHGGEGDTVYDPFLGSGTTLIAAHRLGRTCYGCELDPAYADVILKRAEAEGLACEKAG